MTDNLDGVFDHLQPDDFKDPAKLMAKMPTPLFDHGEFVRRCLAKAEFAFYAADGRPNPMAVLYTLTGDAIFYPHDRELMGKYVDRLAREARKVHAQASFIMKLTQVGTVLLDEDEPQPDVTDPAAMARTQSTPGMYFYSEAMDGHVVHGFWRIKGTGGKARLHDFTLTETNQPNEILHRILRKG